MKKKVISLILAATMVATMATGCGNSSGETTTTDNAASTTTDAAAPATEASDTADAVTDAAGGDYADKKVGVCIYQFSDNFMTLFRLPPWFCAQFKNLFQRHCTRKFQTFF